MEKDVTICFQTTSEISDALNKIAEDENRTVSEVVGSMINRCFQEKKDCKEAEQNRRRFERKKVDLQAYIGDARWQRHDFEAITILDISIGGVRFCVPRGTKLEFQRADGGEANQIILIFRLPNCHWPINVKIVPQRISESEQECYVGAAIVNPDFHAYSSMQKYLI